MTSNVPNANCNCHIWRNMVERNNRQFIGTLITAMETSPIPHNAESRVWEYFTRLAYLHAKNWSI